MVTELIMEASNILRKRVNDDTSIPHSGNMSEASAQSSNQAYFRSQEYYIHHESFKLFVGSWNVGGVRPPDNLNLDKLLNTQDTMADIYVLGHLASGGKEGDERHRNADAAHILARTLFLPEPLQHLPRKILDHDRVIWLGDLNYRIHLPEDTTRSLVMNKEWSLLLENDQLIAEMNKGRAFEEWHEELIEFAPTYKYDQNSDDYYGPGLKQIQYNRVESRLSDHRPVYARFTAYVEVSKLPGMQSSALSS
ncbi:hypothetical protein SASPL_125025 [Salvia splendens]|uniref:Inositol polyphosphate-related phosphatase domain-containing protein n=1 Tax=Salvia splendens TaxID=180675 RepID=A0A8X8ZPN7_SALSN|nr:hypothetical protein SASPL_125025 [Salvia splendens]